MTIVMGACAARRSRFPAATAPPIAGNPRGGLRASPCATPPAPADHLRDELHNFLHNLPGPLVSVNFLLHGHPGKAAEVGRFALNSTVGAARLIDGRP